VKSGLHWSDVLYDQLHVAVSQSKFIESSPASAPRDGTKVGERWQYANVKGGPDKRFKNNRRLPVMLYSHIELASAHGLNWNLQLSRHDPAKWWQQILGERPNTPMAERDSADVASTG
jgi:DNA polymerase-3 subunit epsilon